MKRCEKTIFVCQSTVHDFALLHTPLPSFPYAFLVAVTCVWPGHFCLEKTSVKRGPKKRRILKFSPVFVFPL